MRRYLLDTNIFVFYAQGGENLNGETTEILEDYESLVYVSSEVIKETIHLMRYKRITVNKWKDFSDIWRSIDEWGFNVDYVGREHLLTLGRLIPVKDHKDPTDHIIIAQGITNKMIVISSDKQFENYTKQGLNLMYNKR